MPIYTVTTEGGFAMATSGSDVAIRLTGDTGTKARILGWGISCKGATQGVAPVLVEFMRFTTAGINGTAITEIPLDPDTPTAQLIAHAGPFDTNPAAGAVIESHELNPQGLVFARRYPPGREPVIDNITSTHIGLRTTSTVSDFVVCWVQWDEQ